MKNFFRGLRGRLTLTYTLVTVLALLALEVALLTAISLLSMMLDDGTRDYLRDVESTLAPQAREFLAASSPDLLGLQAWLDGVYASGFASLPPQAVFDSAAARIVKRDPLYVLDAHGLVLVQAPGGSSSLVGRRFEPPAYITEDVLQRAINGEYDPIRLSARTPGDEYWLAVPVRQEIDSFSPVIAVIVVTVEAPPPAFFSVFPVLLGWVLGTGVVLLIGVAPFGALFGFIMSRGLTRRLGALAAVADAWSEGDFTPSPSDRSKDEIGMLGARMRHMATRLQDLLKTQKTLALVEERNRLARELHDTVKQQTFATLMQVRAARNLLERDPQAAAEALAQAEELIKASQQELNLVITELRPAALDEQGLAGALRQYAGALARTAHIPVEVQVRGERSLPVELEQTIYRVGQEALSNAARHSRASAMSVTLDYQAGCVCLQVRDNGVGFDPSNPADHGYGLRSMRERVESVRGRLLVESSAGEGTLVKADFPL